jgi:hypothetical protein
MFGQLVFKKENINHVEKKFNNKYEKSLKKLSDLSWLNFNCQKIFMKNKFSQFLDILNFEKEIFSDQCIYINVNQLNLEALNILSLFLSNRKDFLKVKIYVSEDIIENTTNWKTNLEKFFELILNNINSNQIFDYLSIIVNKDLNYKISEMNFSLLKSAIKKNKSRIEILKLEGLNFSDLQKGALCNLIVEYTYFDNLRIFAIDEEFSNEQLEKFNYYFDTSRNHIYFLINDIERININ